ncbi:MAG: hypothetical protein ABRQ24_04070 [Syntrophomonadaceae bacterium]
MDSKIRQIQQKIDELEAALQHEYEFLAEKYGFSIHQKRIEFLHTFRERNKTFRIPAWKYAIPVNIRHVLSIPFIYMMVVPTIILDLFLTMYNWTALPLYRIPVVKRRDYIVYDRQFLDYLNWIQKINCVYCTYVNGVFAYAVELGGRTERYWCPIKAAKKRPARNNWYSDYADYGSPEQWLEKFNQLDSFEKLKEQ